MPVPWWHHQLPAGRALPLKSPPRSGPELHLASPPPCSASEDASIQQAVKRVTMRLSISSQQGPQRQVSRGLPQTALCYNPTGLAPCDLTLTLFIHKSLLQMSETQSGCFPSHFPDKKRNEAQVTRFTSCPLLPRGLPLLSCPHLEGSFRNSLSGLHCVVGKPWSPLGQWRQSMG